MHLSEVAQATGLHAAYVSQLVAKYRDHGQKAISGKDRMESDMSHREGCPAPCVQSSENPEELVLDALNAGMLSMGRKSEEVIQQGVLDFVNKYGLLGMMCLPPPIFMDYEAVCLPKNPYIREESMQTNAYLELFYPFDKLGNL